MCTLMENCVTQPGALRSSRGHQSSFDQRIARNFKRCFSVPLPVAARRLEPQERQRVAGGRQRWRGSGHHTAVSILRAPAAGWQLSRPVARRGAMGRDSRYGSQ